MLGARADRDGAHGDDRQGGFGAPEAAPAPVDEPTPEPTVTSPVETAADRFGNAVAERHRWVAQLAFSMCGDSIRAEDAVADAYARLWARYRRGRIDNVLPHLVRGVIARLRDHPTRRTVTLDDERGTKEPARSALLALPFEERAVLVLHYVEGISLGEVAVLLGEDEHTVAGRADGGLARLAGHLEMPA